MLQNDRETSGVSWSHPEYGLYENHGCVPSKSLRQGEVELHLGNPFGRILFHSLSLKVLLTFFNHEKYVFSDLEDLRSAYLINTHCLWENPLFLPDGWVMACKYRRP